MTTAIPPARPTEKTRDRILDAAASVLAQRGFAEPKLGEIAAIADVKPPADYYDFGSRMELLA